MRCVGRIQLAGLHFGRERNIDALDDILGSEGAVFDQLQFGADSGGARLQQGAIAGDYQPGDSVSIGDTIG